MGETGYTRFVADAGANVRRELRRQMLAYGWSDDALLGSGHVAEATEATDRPASLSLGDFVKTVDDDFQAAVDFSIVSFRQRRPFDVSTDAGSKTATIGCELSVRHLPTANRLSKAIGMSADVSLDDADQLDLPCPTVRDARDAIDVARVLTAAVAETATGVARRFATVDALVELLRDDALESPEEATVLVTLLLVTGRASDARETANRFRQMVELQRPAARAAAKRARFEAYIAALGAEAELAV